jgi:putative ABC transport system permease protein
VRTPIKRRRRPVYLIDPGPDRRWFAGLRQDLTYARRSLLHRPSLAATIVVVLGVGLAANATVFTIADALVLRPFRLEGVDRTVVARSFEQQDERLFDTSSVAPADYLEWRGQVRSLAPLAAASYWNPNVTEAGEAEALAGVRVSASFFDVLGAAPAIGRGFTAADEQPGEVTRVIISHRLWARRFGSDRSVVGRTIRLDGRSAEVIGVAPERFNLPLGADVWGPLVIEGEALTDRRRGNLVVAGRLAPGATLATARAELEALAARQRAANPDTNAKRFVVVDTYTHAMSDPVARPFVAIWQVAALLLLAVAAANVVNLLLARAAERQQEFAVRLALGAGRARLMRQLLIEGGLLAAAASALALPLSAAALGLTRRAMPAAQERFVPGWERMELGPSTIAMTLALAAVLTVVITLAPAAQSASVTVIAGLRNGGRTLTAGRRRAWGRALLAGSQIALTLALATAAGLGIDAVSRVTRLDLGFTPDHLLMARLLVPDDPYGDPERRRQFAGDVLARLSSVPSVRAAAVSSAVPHGFMMTSRSFMKEGAVAPPGESPPLVDLQRVSDGYFAAMQLPLLAGRLFGSEDTPSGPATAVVSASLARRQWPGGDDPLGRRFRFAADAPWLTVVGVVGDVPFSWIERGRVALVYRPASQEPPFSMHFVVRTVADPLAAAGELRRAIAAADRNVPIQELAPMLEMIDERSAGLLLAARTLTTIGLISVLLAVVGVYSLMSYLTSRRTLEIGVRMACGATASEVLRELVRPAARIALAGIAAGALLALALGQAMQSVLFGSVVADAWLVAGLALALGAAALAASIVPARRLAAIDPSTALRSE